MVFRPIRFENRAVLDSLELVLTSIRLARNEQGRISGPHYPVRSIEGGFAAFSWSRGHPSSAEGSSPNHTFILHVVFKAVSRLTLRRGLIVNLDRSAWTGGWLFKRPIGTTSLMLRPIGLAL